MAGIYLNNFRLFCVEDGILIDGKQIKMSRMERKLLLFFAGNPNLVLSRERLLREVWEYDYCGATRTVDTHVKILRAHLGSRGEHIVTVRGIGYRFDTEKAKTVRKRGVRDSITDSCGRAAS